MHDLQISKLKCPTFLCIIAFLVHDCAQEQNSTQPILFFHCLTIQITISEKDNIVEIKKYYYHGNMHGFSSLLAEGVGILSYKLQATSLLLESTFKQANMRACRRSFTILTLTCHTCSQIFEEKDRLLAGLLITLEHYI